MKNLTKESLNFVAGGTKDECINEIKDIADKAVEDTNQFASDVLDDIGAGATTTAEKINKIIDKKDKR